ncbi:KAP family P-loop NTPase fold protein [Bacillus thuringiensis]|uniref:KAP family P-loop NTPase fold protein n=1 Tax=Bacillus thuringiensis TaxID=1428 RepID=UPI001FBAD852|nr:P-loop NTPase fold protein [Bacillus thuringiensis]
MNMKRLFGVGIGSIFIYFILSVCRMNLSTLNSLLENNMMKLFLIASFTLVLCFVSYININLERKGLYYKEYEYFPKRYLVQMMFWFGIGFNYLTPPFYQMNFQGNLLSVLFDMAFYYSMSSLCVFGILFVGKIIRKQKSKKLQESKSSNKPYFYSDNPVSNNRDDKLNREKFVNHVISSLNKINGENLTIGFYGKWGSGKTSIFKMIKEKIEDENNKDEYLIFEFKPWYFGKEDHEIIVEFLEQLLSEIRKSNGFDPKIEKNIIKYSKAFSSVSLRLPGITINLKETHSLIEELFSKKSQSIKDIKEAIEELLKNSDKKIVVFIDDIDRLNKEEIQTIFRLVRLICDFPNITYIVALDEEIVAAALAELHGKDENIDAKKVGRDYLEKFIQIPLYIPETDVYSLNEMLWAGVREVLEENNLMERSEFLRIENSSIQRLIDLQKFEFSPRNINRYLNTLKFMVPLLKDETNIDDLLYLLFIKVSAPGLYEIIRVSSSELLGVNSKNNLIKEEIEKKYPGYKMVMENLFPDLRIKIPDDRDSSNKYYAIERKSRICSEDYFNRYFMYDVSESERALTNFAKELSLSTPKYLIEHFEGFLEVYSAEKIFTIVEYSIDKWNENQCEKMIEVMQEGINSKSKFQRYRDEYIRMIILISIHMHKKEKKPIFSKGLDLKMINQIYKIIRGSVYDRRKISKIIPIEREVIERLKDILDNEIKKYYRENSFGDIFKQYSIKENIEFFKLWDEAEETKVKREIVHNWIKNEDVYKEVVDLIINLGNEKYVMSNIKPYRKVLELVDMKDFNYYLDQAHNKEKEIPEYYNELFKLRKLVIAELKSETELEIKKILGASRDSSLELNEDDKKVLDKYGDSEVRNILIKHKRNLKDICESNKIKTNL